MSDMARSSGTVIGVVCGSDDVRNVAWDYGTPTHSSGTNDSWAMLKLVQPGLTLHRIHLTPGYYRQHRRWSVGDYDLLWNTISDEDQNAKTLAVAQKFVSETKLPVINPPKLIPTTSRVEIARRLAGLDGVRVPKVLLLRNPTRERVGKMVEAADFKFPAIVRRTGTHNGVVVGLFPDLDSLEDIFGDRKNEYFLIEFVDVRRADGNNSKTRFFFIGDQIITRQHIIAKDWSIHGRSSSEMREPGNEHLLAESRAMLSDGFDALPEETRRRLHAIRERAGLDYCGLDCALMPDGEIVLFECNATMNFNPHLQKGRTAHNMLALPRVLDAMRGLIETRTGKKAAG